MRPSSLYEGSMNLFFLSFFYLSLHHVYSVWGLPDLNIIPQRLITHLLYSYRPFPQVRREFGTSPLSEWYVSNCRSTEASARSFHSMNINF